MNVRFAPRSKFTSSYKVNIFVELSFHLHTLSSNLSYISLTKYHMHKTSIIGMSQRKFVLQTVARTTSMGLLGSSERGNQLDTLGPNFEQSYKRGIICGVKTI